MEYLRTMMRLSNQKGTQPKLYIQLSFSLIVSLFLYIWWHLMSWVTYSSSVNGPILVGIGRSRNFWIWRHRVIKCLCLRPFELIQEKKKVFFHVLILIIFILEHMALICTVATSLAYTFTYLVNQDFKVFG